MEKIALIADIHGNIPAFEAVLADIRRRGITRIFCLGDLIGKGPHPEKAVDICRRECEITLMGNWDYFMSDDKDYPPLRWHRQRLGEERLDYLRNLPGVFDFHLSGRRVRLLHASQIGVAHRVHMFDSEEKHLAMFTATDFTGIAFQPDTVGYGDIHQVYMKDYHGKILFNVGSVGNPLDEPLAAYVILEGNYGDESPGLFSIGVIRLPYDIELAIQQAKDEDMPELEAYENELRTARYRGIKP
jgi:protein phosphatase